jgi:hypothetical protein
MGDDPLLQCLLVVADIGAERSAVVYDWATMETERETDPASSGGRCLRTEMKMWGLCDEKLTVDNHVGSFAAVVGYCTMFCKEYL